MSHSAIINHIYHYLLLTCNTYSHWSTLILYDSSFHTILITFHTILATFHTILITLFFAFASSFVNDGQFGSEFILFFFPYLMKIYYINCKMWEKSRIVTIVSVYWNFSTCCYPYSIKKNESIYNPSTCHTYHRCIYSSTRCIYAKAVVDSIPGVDATVLRVIIYSLSTAFEMMRFVHYTTRLLLPTTTAIAETATAPQQQEQLMIIVVWLRKVSKSHIVSVLWVWNKRDG